MPTGTRILYFVHTTHAGPREATSRQKKTRTKNIFVTTFRPNIEPRRKKTSKRGNGQKSGNVHDITDVGLTRLPRLLLPQHRHRKDGSLSPAPKTPHTTKTTEIKTADVTSHVSPWCLPPSRQSSQKLSSCMQGLICLSCQNIAPHGGTEPPLTVSLSLGAWLAWGGLPRARWAA